jgi:enoyl-CoA hydratase/carnithine racemase
MKQSRCSTVRQAIAIEVAASNKRLASPEAREALRAFFEKRQPDFSRFS